MRFKGLVTRTALVAATFLWLTPSYVCTMGSACPAAKPTHSCCASHDTAKKSSEPCRPNATCGIEQHAVGPQLATSPSAPQSIVYAYLPPASHAIIVTPRLTSAAFDLPSRGHPARDLFSTASNLSPPVLA